MSFQPRRPPRDARYNRIFLYSRASLMILRHGITLSLRHLLILLTAIGPLLVRLAFDAASGQAVVQQFMRDNAPRHLAVLLQLLKEAEGKIAVRYFAAPQLYLAVGAQLAPQDLATRAPHAFKVSSADNIERLIRQALSGMALTHVPSPPPAIPVTLQQPGLGQVQGGHGFRALLGRRGLAARLRRSRLRRTPCARRACRGRTRARAARGRPQVAGRGVGRRRT